MADEAEEQPQAKKARTEPETSTIVKVKFYYGNPRAALSSRTKSAKKGDLQAVLLHRGFKMDEIQKLSKDALCLKIQTELPHVLMDIDGGEGLQAMLITALKEGDGMLDTCSKSLFPCAMAVRK